MPHCTGVEHLRVEMNYTLPGRSRYESRKALRLIRFKPAIPRAQKAKFRVIQLWLYIRMDTVACHFGGLRRVSPLPPAIHLGRASSRRWCGEDKRGSFHPPLYKTKWVISCQKTCHFAQASCCVPSCLLSFSRQLNWRGSKPKSHLCIWFEIYGIFHSSLWQILPQLYHQDSLCQPVRYLAWYYCAQANAFVSSCEYTKDHKNLFLEPCSNFFQ